MQQELQDLCEDLRDMYETADQYFSPKDRVQHQLAASKARFVLWKDRSRCERDLLGPCEHALQMDADAVILLQQSTSSAASQAVLGCHDLWTRRQQPPHPDSYACYIDAVRSTSVMTMTHPAEIMTKLQWIRALYQKGLAAAAGANTASTTSLSTLPTTTPSTDSTSVLWSLFGRDYELALREFCQEYLEFEHLFGSDESYEKASQAVFKKRGAVWSATATTATQPTLLEDTQPQSKQRNVSVAQTSAANEAADAGATTLAPEQASDGKKRPRPADDPTDDGIASTKKLRVGDESTNDDDRHPEQLPVATTAANSTQLEESLDSMQLETPSNNDSLTKREKKLKQPKVRIGNLEYPAHPFTVRVSNLSPDTEDMDLVDVFRPKCGPIVHAKIICDKYPPHASKGWGLIQFEERDGVDKALELHDVIGIHERLVQVERSHMPAATLVPPGKHRVKPKGQGKSTKRNEKRKTGKHDDHNVNGDRATGQQTQQQQTVKMDSVPTESNVSLPNKADKQSTTPSNKNSVFAFRPRNLVVGHKSDHRKVKLALDKTSQSSQQP
jgi:RNA recognition motif-containing protein